MQQYDWFALANINSAFQLVGTPEPPVPERVFKTHMYSVLFLVYVMRHAGLLLLMALQVIADLGLFVLEFMDFGHNHLDFMLDYRFILESAVSYG